jgi:hypothetical protein
VSAADRTLSPGVVVAAVAALLVLAIGMPYAAVSALHARRLARADRDLAALATSIARTPPLRAGDVLLGPGDRPRAVDPLWTTAPASPMPGAVRSDPWGNAYVAMIGAGGRAAGVLSAGPDGILQTHPGDPVSPAGDDRGAIIQR